ncbi:hypothetical protein D3C84_582490 [compost metagenome]
MQERINGLVHSRNHTIVADEQSLHFTAQLLVVQRRLELGVVEFQGTVFGSVDTQLAQRGQPATGLRNSQLGAQRSQQRASGRVASQRTEYGITVFILAGGSQAVNRLDQVVVGVDKGLHVFFQTVAVEPDCYRRFFTLRLELQRQTADRFVQFVGLADNGHTIDFDLGIYGQIAHSASRVTRHCHTAADGQLGNAAYGNIRTQARGGRTEYQSRTLTIIDDVGRDAILTQRIVNAVTHRLQGGIGTHFDLVDLAVLGDFQGTLGNRRISTREHLARDT